ncbi:hypothetical protein Dimus_031507 [Dionaea muscipula]
MGGRRGHPRKLWVGGRGAEVVVKGSPIVGLKSSPDVGHGSASDGEKTGRKDGNDVTGEPQSASSRISESLERIGV